MSHKTPRFGYFLEIFQVTSQCVVRAITGNAIWIRCLKLGSEPKWVLSPVSSFGGAL